MRARLGGPIYCDTGPNEGLVRYDGSLYLTEAEDAQLTPELASPVGLPAVGPGRFEFRDDLDEGTALVCTGCEKQVCWVDHADDLTTVVGFAAGHECAPAAPQ